VDHPYVRVSEALQTIAGGIRERGVALDRDHLPNELGESTCGLITGAGADLEYAVVGLGD
jgi:hypothetical protein